eukprot:5744710-Alexandrium_andersonii.AAC.1
MGVRQSSRSKSAGSKVAERHGVVTPPLAVPLPHQRSQVDPRGGPRFKLAGATRIGERWRE